MPFDTLYSSDIIYNIHIHIIMILLCKDIHECHKGELYPQPHCIDNSLYVTITKTLPTTVMINFHYKNWLMENMRSSTDNHNMSVNDNGIL